MAGTATLAVDPASPASKQGIVFTVTGTVKPTGRIVVTKSGALRCSSTEFGQNALPGVTDEVVSLEVASATDGTFTLSGEYDLVVDPRRTDTIELAETDPIDHDATAADVLAALVAAGWDVVASVDGGPLGTDPLVITFTGKRAVTVTVDDGNLVGDGAAATIAEETAGGVEVEDLVPGGPFVWGPIYLGAGTYSADVLFASVADDDEEHDVGDPMTDAPVALVVSA